MTAQPAIPRPTVQEVILKPKQERSGHYSIHKNLKTPDGRDEPHERNRYTFSLLSFHVPGKTMPFE